MLWQLIESNKINPHTTTTNKTRPEIASVIFLPPNFGAASGTFTPCSFAQSPLYGDHCESVARTVTLCPLLIVHSLWAPSAFYLSRAKAAVKLYRTGQDSPPCSFPVLVEQHLRFRLPAEVLETMTRPIPTAINPLTSVNHPSRRY